MSMTEYLIITGDTCVWCDKVKALLDEKGKTYSTVSIDDHPEIFVVMKAIGAKTVPQALKVVGGFEATVGDLG